MYKKLLFEEVQVFTVPFFLKILLRDESERSRVHAIALARRRGTIIEDVAQVRVRVLAAHLSACLNPAAIDINAIALLIPVFVLERRLGPLFLGYFVLQGREDILELLIRWFLETRPAVFMIALTRPDSLKELVAP